LVLVFFIGIFADIVKCTPLTPNATLLKFALLPQIVGWADLLKE